MNIYIYGCLRIPTQDPHKMAAPCAAAERGVAYLVFYIYLWGKPSVVHIIHSLYRFLFARTSGWGGGVEGVLFAGTSSWCCYDMCNARVEPVGVAGVRDLFFPECVCVCVCVCD